MTGDAVGHASLAPHHRGPLHHERDPDTAVVGLARASGQSAGVADPPGTVVAGEQDAGVVADSEPVELVDDAADEVIHLLDRAAMGAAGAALELRGDGLVRLAGRHVREEGLVALLADPLDRVVEDRLVQPVLLVPGAGVLG